MKKQLPKIATLVCLTFGISSAALAATVPYTEHFPIDNAAWKDTNFANLAHLPTGGPDSSSYVSGSLNFQSTATGDTLVLFRGQDEFGFSGGNFLGNWSADGVARLSAQVRHNAPVPLSYFVRLSSPFGFPGAVAVQLGVVLPNQWTEIEFDLTPSSPQIVTYEGSDWPTVFGNVGHVQLGVSVTAALAGVPATYGFDLDQVAIALPEPSTLLLGLMGGALVLGRRRSYISHDYSILLQKRN